MAQLGRLGRAALARAVPATRAAVAAQLKRAGGVHHELVAPVSVSALRLRGHKEEEDEELVALRTETAAQHPSIPVAHHEHEHEDADVDGEEDEDMEDMVAIGPAGKEWGGPTRGGKFKEPTRYGDWERKGRCSDF